MSAFTGTPASSNEYAEQIAGKTHGHYLANGRAQFTYTHALGAGTGEINLIRLPPGLVTVFNNASLIRASQMVSTADLHVGYRAYTNPVTGAVAADDNAFLDNADVGGGAIDSALLLPAAPAAFLRFHSTTGIVIYAMIDTANIEDGDTINGYIAYSSN